MGFVDRLSGKTAAKASEKAGDIQQAAALSAATDVGVAGQGALDLFDPFSGLGQQGLDQSAILTDPQAQFDFLQNNPLFQMGLDNANTQTQQLAAARGRLSSGDTLQQLNQNALLTAAPLIGQQQQNVSNLIGQGLDLAGNQANLLTGTASDVANLTTGAAAASAAGKVGAANARGQGASNLLGLGLGGLGAAAGLGWKPF